MSIQKNEQTGHHEAPRDLLTIAEAAALLRVERDTAYKLATDGTIPAVRLGKSIRVPRAALLAHVERLAAEAVR